MYFDVYEGLSEEYRSYRLIQPNQLDFRPAADDVERRTAADLAKSLSKDAVTLFVAGGVLIAIGAVAAFFGPGGFVLIMFGILPIVFGVLKKKKSSEAKLVATGVLVKKEDKSAGSVKNRNRRTFRWLVFEVDGMEKTLCTIHAGPEEYDELRVGDRILVINDNSIFYGKKLG